MYNFEHYLLIAINIGTQCVQGGIYSICVLYQLLTKLENTDEDLTEERRRHEETRNQLETTKRLLEAAEKVFNPFSPRIKPCVSKCGCTFRVCE